MEKLNRLGQGKLGEAVLKMERGIGNLRLGFPKSIHSLEGRGSPGDRDGLGAEGRLVLFLGG